MGSLLSQYLIRPFKTAGNCVCGLPAEIREGEKSQHLLSLL